MHALGHQDRVPEIRDLQGGLYKEVLGVLVTATKKCLIWYRAATGRTDS